MKRRIYLTFFLSAAALLLLWIGARITGIINFYSISSESNWPTFKPGGHLFTSNLKKPHRGDFICFRHPADSFSEEAVFVHRICGVGGDVIQVRKGLLFINGQPEGPERHLAHLYRVTQNELRQLGADEPRIFHTLNGDTVAAILPDEMMATHGLKQRMYAQPAGNPDPMIASLYGQPWNADNFGPFLVPEATYFVMGDNRCNALDSRYTGVVPASDYIGTVLR